MEYTKGEWKIGHYIVYADKPIPALICNTDIGIVSEAEKTANAQLILAAPALYEAYQEIMLLDDSGALEAMAYSGGDVPKKWLREVAPAITARSKARKEVKEIIRKVLAKVENK